MIKLLSKPVRYLVKMSVETVVVGWFVQNRKPILTRLSKLTHFGNNDAQAPDLTRAVGDRFVPIAADRDPSAFESAVADSLPPVSATVEAHLEDAASHVRIGK